MPLIYRASIKKYIKKSHDVFTVLIAGGNTSVEGVGHLGVGGGGGGCCAVNKKPYTILAQKLTPLCKTIITTHTHIYIYIYIYISICATSTTIIHKLSQPHSASDIKHIMLAEILQRLT